MPNVSAHNILFLLSQALNDLNPGISDIRKGRWFGAKLGQPGSSDTGYATGAVFFDMRGGVIYQNSGQSATPNWTVIGGQA